MGTLVKHDVVKRKYAVVCVCILAVGALTIAVLASTPALAYYPSLLCGKTTVRSHGLIAHIHISENGFGSAEALQIQEADMAHNRNMSATTAEEEEEEEEAANQSSAQALHADGILNGGLMKKTGLNGNFSQQKGGCSKRNALLKVFMYDLPPEFHFGMIVPRAVNQGATWPDLTHVVGYPGGLTEQHSVEYWLTLDLLYNSEEEETVEEEEEEEEEERENGHVDEVSDPEVAGYLNMEQPLHVLSRPHRSLGRRRRPCGAVRVKEAEDADIFFVPFFASLSYNKYARLKRGEKDIELQRKVVNFVVKQEAWRRSRGRDHVIVMHHPNSLHVARASLQGATFVVADFGRFSSKIAHFGKDVVAPYKHVIPSFHQDSTSFLSRPTLLFFQGAIIRKEGGAIRKKLYSLLRNEEGVVFKDRVLGPRGVDSATEGMRSSKFCLHLAGDTPSSNRLFDAIVSHCVPVIISESIELPYEHALDYSKFCVFVSAQHALRRGFLLDLLRSIREEEWTSMWRRLRSVGKHFDYRFPSLPDDAVQMIWKSIAYKVPSIKQGLHKSDRYSRSVTYKRNPSF